MDSSVPYILPPQVWVTTTPSTHSSIYWIVLCWKDENKQKEAWIGPFNKLKQKIFEIKNPLMRWQKNSLVLGNNQFWLFSFDSNPGLHNQKHFKYFQYVKIMDWNSCFRKSRPTTSSSDGSRPWTASFRIGNRTNNGTCNVIPGNDDGKYETLIFLIEWNPKISK